MAPIADEMVNTNPRLCAPSPLLTLFGLTLALVTREWAYGQLNYLFGIESTLDSKSIQYSTGLDNDEYAWLVGVGDACVVTVFYLVSGILGTLSTFRRRKERLVIAGLLIQAVGVLVIANAYNAKVIVVGQLINAAGAGLSYPAAFRVVHDFFPGRAAASGLLVGARSFGTAMCSAGLWSVEDKSLSWRSQYYMIMASICIVALYLMLVPVMSDVSVNAAARGEATPTDEQRSSDASKKEAPESLADKLWEVCISLFSPFAGLLVVGSCLAQASDDLMSTWGTSFFLAITSKPEMYALENAIIVQMVAGTIGTVCGGLLADRWETKGLTSQGPNPAAMVQVPAIGLIIAAFSMYGMLYSNDYVTAFLCDCLFLPAQKMVYAGAYVAIQGASKPELRDVALSVFMFLTLDVGAMLGSVIGEGQLTYEDKLAYIVPFNFAGGVILWMISGWYSDQRVYADIPEPPRSLMSGEAGEDERLIVSDEPEGQ